MGFLTAISNALRLPDVRNRLAVTVLILIIYKVATLIPVPGITPSMLEQARSSELANTTAFQALNIMAGGALANFSIVALSIYPFLAALELFDKFTPLLPRLEMIIREPGGDEKRLRLAAYLAIPVAILTALIGEDLAVPLLNIERAGFLEGLTVMTVLTAGTFFSLWMAQLIDEDGMGNGVALIIFANIVGELPTFFAHADQWGLAKTGLIVLVIVVLVYFMIRMSEAVRRLPVQYGKRVRGRGDWGTGSNIPLAVVPTRLTSIESSYGILIFLTIVLQYLLKNHPGPFINSLTTWFLDGWPVLLFVLVLITSFRGMVSLIEERNLAVELQRNGGFIPGLRPGQRTQEYVVRVASRLAWLTAPYLALLSILPWLLQGLFGLGEPVYLVVVLWVSIRIIIDMARQLEAMLVLRNYQGFMR